MGQTHSSGRKEVIIASSLFVLFDYHIARNCYKGCSIQYGYLYNAVGNNLDLRKNLVFLPSQFVFTAPRRGLYHL